MAFNFITAGDGFWPQLNSVLKPCAYPLLYRKESVKKEIPLKTLVIIIFSFLVLTPAAQAAIQYRAHKPAHKSPRNIEVWCGALSTSERSEFPYLAAIRNVKLKKGRHARIAEIYKGRKVVFRQYVTKNNQSGGTTYVAPGELFSLKMTHGSIAQFQAVISDGQADELISNGQYQCYPQS